MRTSSYIFAAFNNPSLCRFALVVSVLASVAAGCMTQTRPTSYGFSGAATSGTPSNIARDSNKDVLVVIRYPAFVDSDAETLYQKLYDNRGFTNIFFNPPMDSVELGWQMQDPQVNVRARDMEGGHLEALLKTTYLAIDFYRYLSGLLPPNSVRLQPVRISQRIARKNAPGAIAWGETAPVTLVEVPTESYPPAVLYVDIFAHVHPYWRIPYEAYNWGTTFGKTVLPLITVRTSPRGSPKTLGGIAGMNAFVPYLRIPPVTADATDGLGVTFVEYLNGTAGVPPTLKEFSKDQLSDRPPVSLDRYLSLSLKVFTLNETVLREQAGKTSPVGTPSEPIFTDYYQIIREALGLIPYAVATRDARIRYVSWFDPRLGQSLVSGVSPSERDQLKLEILRKFEQAEWDFLGKKDEELIAKTFWGPWGSFVRDQRVAEEDFRVRFQKAESEAQANLMFKSFMSGLTPMGPGGFGSLATLATAIKLSREAIREQTKINEQLVGISKTFQQNLQNEVDRELKFVFDVGGESVELRAKSLEELRFKMKRVYEERFPLDSSER